jgi:hypothetical protein
LGSPTRIIRVTYNNSNDADKIFITDYNLQGYVPIPLTEEEPVRSVTRGGVTVAVTWEKEQTTNNFDPIPGSGYTFESGAVYRADIRVTANDLYRFFESEYFEYPAGAVTTQPGYDDDAVERNFTVTYKAAGTPTVVSDLNLTPYIHKPINGAMGVTSFAGPQYTGTVRWEPAAGPFQAGTAYTAEVSLTPAAGYSFTGAGPFVNTGAETVTNTATGVRIGFSATPSVGGAVVIYDTNLTSRIPRPISGESPVMGITGLQYTGAVTWMPMPPSTFQYDTVYTAVLTLQGAPGYTFAGIGQNIFTHDDAPKAVTNLPGSSTVTITFPPTASATYLVITSFGPAEQEGSALKLMREKKGDNNLTIDLPGEMTEVVASNRVTLVAGENSPAKVIINGHHRVLTLGGTGTLLTVGSGVTLTLRDITLSGISGNDAPLVTVQTGGKLILGSGVSFTGNETSADAGGVWVNGGELVLNLGAKIKEMEAQEGGGVLIDAYGTLVMNGGTIGGEDSTDGNRASRMRGGGGVMVTGGGTFIMAGGTIQSNRVLEDSSGGGVMVMANGRFNMFDGTIQSNIAAGGFSGGGVGILEDGTFTLYDGTIKGNSALGSNASGGGVFAGPTSSANFFMHGGIIGGEDANTAAKGAGANGVCIIGGQFTMSGGTIMENTANNTSDYGVLYSADYESTFTMMGSARIDEEDMVFLTSSNSLYYPSVITIGGDLSAPSPAATIIMDPSPLTPGTYLLAASSSELIQRNYQKFQFNGSTLSDIDIILGWNAYYGCYK